MGQDPWSTAAELVHGRRAWSLQAIWLAMMPRHDAQAGGLIMHGQTRG